MFKMLNKFFAFCSKKDRNKFYKSVVLGVLDALFGAMKIPAAFFALKAVLSGNIGLADYVTVITPILML